MKADAGASSKSGWVRPQVELMPPLKNLTLQTPSLSDIESLGDVILGTYEAGSTVFSSPDT